MKRPLKISIVLSIPSILCMCGGGGTLPSVSTPEPEKVAPPASLAPPETPSVVSVPDVKWTPVMVGPEKGEMITAALRAQSKIAIIVPRTQGAGELETQVFQMVKSAAPEVEVVSRNETRLGKLLEDRDVVGYDTAGAEGYFLPKDSPLKKEFASKKASMKGVDAVLAVRPMPSDSKVAQEMRSVQVGSCVDFEKTLSDEISASRGYFTAYENEASELLRKEFTRHLSAAVPFWKEEIKRAASIAPEGSVTQRCSEAYGKFMTRYDACLKGTCDSAPRVFASAGGVIGMLDESGLIPDSCPAAGMRDFVAEMRDLGDRAVAEVLPALEGDWTGEMVRMNGVEKLRAGIDEACAPRHRRIDITGVETARREVVAYLADLRDAHILSTWERMPGQERIPGVGVLQVLARVRSQTVDPGTQVMSILRRLRASERCAQGTGRLFQVALIDPRDARVLYMDTFFEDAIFCEDLPPR